MTNPTKNFHQLINEICDAHGLPSTLRVNALRADPRALKAISGKVAYSTAKIPPLDIFEVAKWGISWESSRYPKLQSLA